MNRKARKKTDYLQVLQDFVDTIRNDSPDPQAEAKRFCLSVKTLDDYLEESESKDFESFCLEQEAATPAHGHDQQAVQAQLQTVVALVDSGRLDDEYDQLRDLACKTNGHIYCDAQRLATLATFIRHCESET